MRGFFTVSMFASALGACSSTATHPPVTDLTNAPPLDGGAGIDAPAAGIPPSTTMSYMAEIGGTVPVAPGTKIGYALTALQAGTYRLRWTGDAAVAADGFQHFYGSVWTPSHFTSVTPGCDNQACPLENGDIVSGAQTINGGERIDWNTVASTGWDGFTFATDAETVYFDVFVDGSRHPDLFFFAAPDGTTSSPTVSPFAITFVGATDGGSDATVGD